MTPTVKKFLISLALIALGISIGLLGAYGLEQVRDTGRTVETGGESPTPEQFDQDFEAMTNWLEDYKRDNPEASDEDARRAFEEIWKG